MSELRVAFLEAADIDKLYRGELVLTPGTVIILDGCVGYFQSASPVVVNIRWHRSPEGRKSTGG